MGYRKTSLIVLLMLKFSLGASFTATNRLLIVTRTLPVRSFRVTVLKAKPKRGAVIDSYRTVSVNCSKCRERLFRYKKKVGS